MKRERTDGRMESISKFPSKRQAQFLSLAKPRLSFLLGSFLDKSAKQESLRKVLPACFS
jgi:hypothetical protein